MKANGLEILTRQPPTRSDLPPLVFVHGAWHAAWCWDEHFLPWFAEKGFEVHAPSLRGHGGSPGRDRLNHLRMRDYIDDVSEVVASLERPPVVIGHSMGGGVVQGLLTRRDRPALAGVALLSSVPPGGVFRLVLTVARRHPGVFAAALATLNIGRLVATPDLVRELFFSREVSDDRIVEYQQRLQSESFLAFLDMLVLDRPRPRPTEVPVFVLGGGSDVAFTVADARKTASAWGITAEIIDGLAHDVMLDTNWEHVAQALLAWLKRSTGR